MLPIFCWENVKLIHTIAKCSCLNKAAVVQHTLALTTSQQC